jgi:hypothetical protein
MARRRVLITTPYPSVNEVAKRHGVPRREVRAITAMVDEILASPRYRRLVKQYRQRHRHQGEST